MASINKEFLLKESKVFCMFPWLHLYVSPKGNVYPCCTTDQSSALNNVKQYSLKEIFNNNKTKQIRLNMLNEKTTDLCRTCYRLEEASSNSYRNFSKDIFSKYFDETVSKTKDDGSLDNFAMRYIDVRFSNICNFKCRTCGSECSSQWAAEEKKLDKNVQITLHADDHKGNLLNEVLQHIDYVDMVYFAGGEPLIMDEHYIILEELIKQKRNNVSLKYNTNGSNLIYKNYDLLDLWKYFSKIELNCSIDHFGKKAEYIRHGTDWAVVETNLLKFRSLPNVHTSISTVLSVFNFVTLAEFYYYLKVNDLIKVSDYNTYLTFTSNPLHFSSTSLPNNLKDEGKDSIEGLLPVLNSSQFDYNNFKTLSNFLKQSIDFTYSQNTYEQSKQIFVKEILLRDELRNENFLKIFPELSVMLNV